MVLALVACGSGDEGGGGGADAGELGDDLVPSRSEPLPCAPCAGDRYDYEGDGVYEVPLAPEHDELDEAASAPVPGARLRIESGQVNLRYDLPIELTGVEQDVDFDGELPDGDEPLVLSGAAGTATCSLSNVDGQSFDIYCFEELPGISFDVAALEVLLENQGLEPAQIQARLEVAELFSEDPIGLFEGTLRSDL